VMVWFFVSNTVVYNYSFSRLLFVSGLEKRMPTALGRVNERKVPVAAILTQTVLASLFVIAIFNPFVGNDNTQRAYWLLQAAVTVIWCVSMVLLFADIFLVKRAFPALFDEVRSSHPALLYASGIVGACASAFGAYVTFKSPWTPLFSVGDWRLWLTSLVVVSALGALIYAEAEVTQTTQASTQSQPFSELVAAVYAVPRVEKDQLVAATSSKEKIPLTGKTVAVKSPVGQGDPWLLVAKARKPLVGSVATWTPWVLLAAGLLAALLAAAIVETMARRREYAMNLVKVRTEELQQSLADLASAHEQLVRQERLAAIGQLASTVGHELRNPLGVISNAVYLLRGDLGPEPTPAAQRHLATAEREVSAATVIVSDLLEFARERQPVVDDVDVTGLLDEVLSILPPPTGVTVERSGDSKVAVRGDREMLRQVLLNLIGNGYQAMPDGGRLTVGASMTDGVAQLHVADTGVGMSAETQQRLFEPFFTTKPRGVGLGLAVTKRIVEAHSGTISVSSEEGRGTEFVVLLPVIAAPRNGSDESVAQEVQA